LVVCRKNNREFAWSSDERPIICRTGTPCLLKLLRIVTNPTLPTYPATSNNTHPVLELKQYFAMLLMLLRYTNVMLMVKKFAAIWAVSAAANLPRNHWIAGISTLWWRGYAVWPGLGVDEAAVIVVGIGRLL